MTAVVLAKNKGDILVAYGNFQLIDRSKTNPHRLIGVTAADMETQRTGILDTEPRERALALATQRVKAWNKDPRVTKKPVKFKLIKKDGEWKIRFLVRGSNGSFGFPKGGIEPGETPEQAAVREFYEETGFTIPPGRLEPTKSPTVFQFNATDAERDQIIAAWNAMGDEGELYGLEWADIAAVKRTKLNPPSAQAIRGGTRRRRFVRKTRRVR
jgi:8-oxo-dGTP pyrophosphatase MutT (NUDIX family)